MVRVMEKLDIEAPGILNPFEKESQMTVVGHVYVLRRR